MEQSKATLLLIIVSAILLVMILLLLMYLFSKMIQKKRQQSNDNVTKDNNERKNPYSNIDLNGEKSFRSESEESESEESESEESDEEKIFNIDPNTDTETKLESILNNPELSSLFASESKEEKIFNADPSTDKQKELDPILNNPKLSILNHPELSSLLPVNAIKIEPKIELELILNNPELSNIIAHFNKNIIPVDNNEILFDKTTEIYELEANINGGRTDGIELNVLDSLFKATAQASFIKSNMDLFYNIYADHTNNGLNVKFDRSDRYGNFIILANGDNTAEGKKMLETSRSSLAKMMDELKNSQIQDSRIKFLTRDGFHYTSGFIEYKNNIFDVTSFDSAGDSCPIDNTFINKEKFQNIKINKPAEVAKQGPDLMCGFWAFFNVNRPFLEKLGIVYDPKEYNTSSAQIFFTYYAFLIKSAIEAEYMNGLIATDSDIQIANLNSNDIGALSKITSLPVKIHFIFQKVGGDHSVLKKYLFSEYSEIVNKAFQKSDDLDKEYYDIIKKYNDKIKSKSDLKESYNILNDQEFIADTRNAQMILNDKIYKNINNIYIEFEKKIAEVEQLLSDNSPEKKPEKEKIFGDNVEVSKRDQIVKILTMMQYAIASNRSLKEKSYEESFSKVWKPKYLKIINDYIIKKIDPALSIDSNDAYNDIINDLMKDPDLIQKKIGSRMGNDPTRRLNGIIANFFKESFKANLLNLYELLDKKKITGDELSQHSQNLKNIYMAISPQGLFDSDTQEIKINASHFSNIETQVKKEYDKKPKDTILSIEGGSVSTIMSMTNMTEYENEIHGLLQEGINSFSER